MWNVGQVKNGIFLSSVREKSWNSQGSMIQILGMNPDLSIFHTATSTFQLLQALPMSQKFSKEAILTT